MTAEWLSVERGETPLLLSLPHTGTLLPAAEASGFVSTERALQDADWHVERLYAFASRMGASTVCTRISRSIIDVNRDPSGRSLYPGMATTALCPEQTFGGEPLYRSGAEPDATAILQRRQAYFDPYHRAVEAEIARLLNRHRRIVVYDCHSIASVVPRLFDGTLPHVNIGTNDARSCAGEVTRTIERHFADDAFSRVTDGRFKGGWITRHYGRPEDGVHAIQVELARRGYLAEVPKEDRPPAWDPVTAEPLRQRLEQVLTALQRWAEA